MQFLKTICLAIALFITSLHSFGQSWRQQVDYQIDVRLDDQANTVQARQRVKYTNASPDTLHYIYFRLAWHGRKAALSSKYDIYAVQQNGVAIDFNIIESREEDAIAPQSFSQNLLEIKLSRPLLPGDADTYTIAWQAEIPKFSGGTGRNAPSGADYIFLHWYPQVCVYNNMGWRLGSPYEPDNSGEFGSYKVDITLPQKYMVAGTGVLTNADMIGYGYENPGVAIKPNYGLVSVWKFQANQICDFVWAADPDFKHQKKQYRDGLTLHSFSLNNDHQLEELETELGKFEQRFMPYQYPQLTVVEAGELRAEYPMMVFSSKTSTPDLIPAISWDFQYNLLKNNYLLKQFIYAAGDRAFQKSLTRIFTPYRYGSPPVDECIHILERTSGYELDWLWEQYANTRTQVDYSIKSVKTGGDNTTSIELERLRGSVLPVVLAVTFADNTLKTFYIPTELQRTHEKEVWNSAQKTYLFKLNYSLDSIRKIEIDPEHISGDVDVANNVKTY